MHLKKMTVAGCAVLSMCAMSASTAVADGLTLSVSRIQQRYPWNGLVDIDYTVDLGSGDALGPDDNLEVLFVDKSQTPAVTNRAISFLQAPLPLTEGTHRITWDANADGVTNRTSLASFSVKIVHYAAAYMVIDVSGGPTTNVYPVTFLNGEPPNGFNANDYKGNKIVLRRIHQGSFMAGSPTDEAGHNKTSEIQHRVAFSKPFYIGLFEVTQKQYENVMGASKNNSAYTGEFRPVEKVSYDTLRGKAVVATHTYDWPWNDDVDPESFMGKLRAKCKAKDADGNYTEDVKGFDLPTEFQWEYACRAGTKGAFNTTNEYDNTKAAEQKAQLQLLGRCVDNQTDGKGGIKANHTVVGSYLPNAWGLYDMHGNVWEWCLDWFRDDVENLKQYVDPVGADKGAGAAVQNWERVFRGGSWYWGEGLCRSGKRGCNLSGYTDGNNGFRLVRNLP